MSIAKSDYTQAELDDIDDRFVQAFAFIRDIIDDPSLIDQFPKTVPHLVVTRAGRFPDATPSFRTPHTDVYIAGKGGPAALARARREPDEHVE